MITTPYSYSADRFWIEFNEKKNIDFGIEVTERPTIPQPSLRMEEIEIAGRDGSLTRTDGTYQNRTIEVSMNFLSKPRRFWPETARIVDSWLNGSGILRTSEDNHVFYKVQKAFASSSERVMGAVGEFTASFNCLPYAYVDGGQFFYPKNDVLINPYEVSHPVYRIEGEGRGALTVNGKVVTAYISGNLIIDTDRMIAYKEEPTYKNVPITKVDYEDLYLQNGENQIVMSAGFTVTVKPNWRKL